MKFGIPGSSCCTHIPCLFFLLVLFAVTSLVLWQVAYCGLRVGEAAVPGPAGKYSTLKLLSASVTSMQTQAHLARELEADIIGLQETRLNEFGQKAMKVELARRPHHTLW